MRLVFYPVTATIVALAVGACGAFSGTGSTSPVDASTSDALALDASAIDGPVASDASDDASLEGGSWRADANCDGGVVIPSALFTQCQDESGVLVCADDNDTLQLGGDGCSGSPCGSNISISCDSVSDCGKVDCCADLTLAFSTCPLSATLGGAIACSAVKNACPVGQAIVCRSNVDCSAAQPSCVTVMIAASGDIPAFQTGICE